MRPQQRICWEWLIWLKCMMRSTGVSADGASVKMPISYAVHVVQQAIYYNDVWGLKEVLSKFTAKQRCDLFQQEGLKQSLHVAYSFERRDMMKYLLAAVPSLVDEVNDQGETVLYRAVCCSKPHFVRLLLEHGGDIQTTETIQRKAMCGFISFAHEALAVRNLETVHLVVEAGSDIQSVNNIGCDILQMSAFPGTWHIFEYLVEKVGKPRPTSNPAVLAFTRGNMELFNRLWKDWKSEPEATETLCIEGIFNAEQREKDVLKLVKSEGTLQDNIFVLEILGATLALWREPQQAIEAWKEAMRLKWKDVCRPVVKVPPQTDLSEILQVAEVQTLEDVERLPVDYTKLLTQAILVMQRHLPSHPILFNMFWSLASTYLKSEEVQKALTVLHETAKMCKEHPDVKEVLELFRQAMQKSLDPVPFQCPSPLLQASIKGLQETMTDESSEVCRSYHLDSIAQDGHSCFYARRIIFWGCRLAETLSLLLTLEVSATPEERAALKAGVKTFLCLASSEIKGVIFHESIKFMEYMDSMESIDSSVLKYLVACSEDLAREGRTSTPPHLTRNRHGQTPLHMFANFLSREELVEDGILGSFLRNGADLCTPDGSGERIADILVKRGILSEGEVLPSLLCLAAREAAKLPRDLLPDNQAIRDFVSQH